SSVDQIVLGEGIVRDELSLRRDGNHMVLLIGGPDSGDSITIENAYTDSQYRIEEIVLADGSNLSPESLPILSSAQDDTLRDGYFADVFEGPEGEVSQYSEGGDVAALSIKSSLLAQAMSSFESSNKVISYSKADSNFVSNNITIPIVER
ncbi:TPA: calcium-binding protein, partial [Vibrio parahaemolyticus]